MIRLLFAAIFTTILLFVLKIGGFFTFSWWLLGLPLAIYWFVWVTIAIFVVTALVGATIKVKVHNESSK